MKEPYSALIVNMARVISPRNILLLITICLIKWINCDEHCEPRDLRALVLHIRELRTEFERFKNDITKQLIDLNSTMENKLDELREMIPLNIGCPEGWEKNGSSCYYIGEPVLNFYEAKEFCENRSANLVHVNDETENDFLRSFMNASERYNLWIGLTDEAFESEWRWIDDETVTDFEDWLKGEPNSQGDQDCCCLFIHNGYKWDDVGCTEFAAAPLCEMVLN